MYVCCFLQLFSFDISSHPQKNSTVGNMLVWWGVSLCWFSLLYLQEWLGLRFGSIQLALPALWPTGCFILPQTVSAAASRASVKGFSNMGRKFSYLSIMHSFATLCMTPLMRPGIQGHFQFQEICSELPCWRLCKYISLFLSATQIFTAFGASCSVTVMRRRHRSCTCRRSDEQLRSFGKCVR